MTGPTEKALPPVSFIIPAFNCAGTLAESVASIFEGNLGPNDEIIIVDDGSTDGTRSELTSLAHLHPEIRLLAHRFNKGGGATRNTAVEAARHSLIFCLDSDNILAPHSVPALRQFLTETGADVASFQHLKYFKTRPEEVTHMWRFKPNEITLADYLANSIVPGASGNYLYTVESWRKAREYPVDGNVLDTWGFGFRQVATGAKMQVLPDSHYFHRYGHDSYWVRGAREKRFSLYALQIILPYLALLDPNDADYLMSPEGRNSWYDRMGKRPLHVLGRMPGQGGIQTDALGRVETKVKRSWRQKISREAGRIFRKVSRQ
ncbi:MAG TPA: glycosyltransferase family 2 protein [Candidatus Methylacidiphilales bacterium]